MEKVKINHAIQRIDEILDLFQNEDCDLEQMIKLYEEGMTLINVCNKKIKDIELKIEEINNLNCVK